jgi:hypothetical protein
MKYAHPDINICVPLIPIVLLMDKYLGIPAPEIFTVFIWVSTGLVWLIWKFSVKDWTTKTKTNKYWYNYWKNKGV